jgi:hypothetical protein
VASPPAFPTIIAAAAENGASLAPAATFDSSSGQH